MPNNEPVGIIGLGLLGGAIADRLVDHGHKVLGFDIDVPKTLNVELTLSPGEVFERTSTVLLSLPTSGHVAEILSKAGAALERRHTIIDTTTGDPEEIVELHEYLVAKNVEYIEANVAGSSDLARHGRAALFLGGDAHVVAMHRPLLDVISEISFHLGPVGNASRFKLVHNLILGLNRAVLAEGLEFASSLGFDPGETLAILTQTPAASIVMETKGDRMVRRDYKKPQSHLAQHLKDVYLILEQAGRSGTPTPLTEVHRALLEKLESIGLGALDNSVIMEAFRGRDGDGDPE